MAIALRQDTLAQLAYRLKQVLTDAKDRGGQHLKLDVTFVELVLNAMLKKEEAYQHLKGQFDGVKVSFPVFSLVPSILQLFHAEDQQTVDRRPDCCTN